MTAMRRMAAENALRTLLVGGSFVGAHWYGTIARLATQRIADVSLGEHHPHLILTFASGQVFFLAGDDAEFESWSIQTSGVTGGDWTIVATPGSNIAISDAA